MVKISWRHWLSEPDICWQLNLFTSYLGSANGKFLQREVRKHEDESVFHIISCCYQHYGIWELPWITSSGCHKNKCVLLLSSLLPTILSHKQIEFAALFSTAHFVAGLSYQPLSTLDVLLLLNYFQNSRKCQRSRIWGGGWEGKSLDTSFPSSLGFIYHVTFMPYFILAEHIDIVT